MLKGLSCGFKPQSLCRATRFFTLCVAAALFTSEPSIAQEVRTLPENLRPLFMKAPGEVKRLSKRKIRPWIKSERPIKPRNIALWGRLSKFKVPLGSKLYKGIVKKSELRKSGAGSARTFYGKLLPVKGKALSDDRAGNFTLVVNRDGSANSFFGSFQVDRKSFALEHNDSGQVVLNETIESGFAPCGNQDSEHIPGLRSSVPAPSLALKSPPVASANGAPTQVDILVVYSSQARVVAGGVGPINAAIMGLVNQTNQAFQNSQVNLYLNLVHTQELLQPETGSFDTDITSLVENGDGIFDEAHTLRQQLGADLVAMINSDDEYCGIARLPLSTAGTPSEAFSITTTRCFSNLTFAHEIGHNFGALHNPEDSGGLPPLLPWVYGHRFIGNDGGSYISVMSYKANSFDVRVPYYSNPAISYMGVPTGLVNRRENARLLNTMGPIIANYSSMILPTPIPQPPNAPSNLIATTLSNSQIKLTWSDNSNNEDNFYITSGDTSEFLYFTPANSTSFTHSDLNSATLYQYHVIAGRRVNDEWLWSAPSNFAFADTFTRPMRAPAPFQAVQFGGSIKLSWQDKTGDEQGFIIERSIDGGPFSELTRTGPNVKAFNDRIQTLGPLYVYRIRAYSGNDSSEPLTAVVKSEYVAPASTPRLGFDQLSLTSVRIGWQNEDGPNIVNKYVIFRTTAPGVPYTTLGEVGPNETTFIDSTVQFDKQYYYDVRAFNNLGNSPTETLPVKTMMIYPENVKTKLVGPNSIKLEWSERNKAGEIIIRRGLGSCESGGGGIALFNYITIPVGTSYTDTGLNSDQDYCYSLAARYQSRRSDYGPPVLGSTKASAAEVKAPIRFSVTKQGAFTGGAALYLLNWANPNPTGETIIYQSNSPGSIGTVELTRVPYKETSYQVSLKYNTTYYFQLRATAYGQFSDFTEVIRVDTGAPPAPTVTPTRTSPPGPTVTPTLTMTPTRTPIVGVPSISAQGLPLSIKINYTAGIGAGTLDLHRSSSANGPWIFRTQLSGVFVDDNIPAGTTYYYRIAKRSGGQTYYSNTAFATALEYIHPATATPLSTRTPTITPTPSRTPTPTPTTIPPTARPDAWRNPSNPLDVNNDGQVTRYDYDLIVARINTYGSGPLPAPAPGFEPPPYYDVNGSGSITGADANMVNSYLLSLFTPTPTATATPTISRYPWQNPINPYDANGDGVVTLADFEVVWNEIIAGRAGLLPSVSPDVRPPPFFDVNGDGYLSSRDAQLIMAQLPTPTPTSTMTSVSTATATPTPTRTFKPIV